MWERYLFKSNPKKDIFINQVWLKLDIYNWMPKFKNKCLPKPLPLINGEDKDNDEHLQWNTHCQLCKEPIYQILANLEVEKDWNGRKYHIQCYKDFYHTK